MKFSILNIISYRNQGIAFADGRININSESYKRGYNTGITDADNRTNPNSTNYKTGYDTGYAAGKLSVTVLTGSVTVDVNDVHQAVTVSFECTLPSKPIVGCYSTDARLGATVIWPSTTGFTASVYSETACNGESIVLHWIAVCQ